MLTGIDTSHFSTYSLMQLKEIAKVNKLYFNFIKATEGVAIKDAKFVEGWDMSRKAGLLCGAYHFFRPLSDANAQAFNFIAQYKLVNRVGVLPPVVDLEWAKTGNQFEQWSQISPIERIPKIRIFLSVLEAELKVKPIIYTAVGFWQEFISSQSTSADNLYFASYPLWIVDLKNSQKLPGRWAAPASFVQYHFGEMATTKELFDNSDQNRFTGTLKDLLNLTTSGFSLMRGFPFSNLVIEIQQQLTAKSFLTDTIDGLFGTNTEAAVKKFQTANGLFENGIVDSQTWNRLL